MTSLFTNTHLRSSHHLAPHPQPPSSFSRSSGVRSQLKKIPSSLFNKGETKSTNAQNEPTRNFLASLSPKRNKTASTLVPSVAPAKVKTGKTRKALADILGWGNNNHHHNQATPPALTKQKSTSTFAPPLPAKENMPHVLKKRPSRPFSGKSSQSGLSGYTSLLVTQETPQTRARPSMGPDPFSRRGEGAEVVDSIERKFNVGSSVKSSNASDKRASVASSKAFSAKTLTGDEDSIRERAPFLVTLDRGAETSSRRISAPMSLHSTLQNVPPRTASLGLVLEHNLPTPPPSATFVDKDFRADYKALKKEKTRSRVWGIFAGGRKKEKIKTNSPEPSRQAFEVRPVEAQSGARQIGTIQSGYTSSTLSSARDLPQSSATRASISRPSGSRPRVPIVHVQQASADTTSSSRPQSLKPLPTIEHSTIAASTHTSQISTESTPMYDSVVGSSPDRPSVEGARYDIVAARGTKARAIPKRKSLTGVFGVALRRSLDKIKPSGSRSSLKAVNEDHATLRGPPSAFNGNTLRSLAEELESAEGASVVVQAPSMPYQSRFGDKVLKAKGSFQKSTGDLRRVASATDKLSALVSLDFSPSPSKTPSDNGSLAAPPSLASMDGSPTPMRRVRSAVLTSKKSAASPIKANISPLKLALHRSQVAAKPKIPIALPSSPPKTTSLVRKGMRNIFAPPTPPRQPELLSVSSGVGLSNRSPAQDLSDIPADLHAIINRAPAVSPEKRSTLGLPPLTPPIRVSPRRDNGRAPPAHSLPPVPNVPSRYSSGRSSPAPPLLTLDLVEEHDRTSIFSDVMSIGEENRKSFDFTNEYASLDQGHQRASFVEAVAEVSSRPQMPTSPLPALASVEEKRESMQSYGEVSEMLHDSAPDSESDDEDDEVEDELEMEIATAVVQRTPRLSAVPTPRKSPFQGQPAFQKHVAQSRVSPPLEKSAGFSQPFNFVSMPAQVELPTRQGRRNHHRDQSGFSIASMSSVGSVIETGIAGDYTNYFEVNFANHLANQAPPHARNHSADSNISRGGSRDLLGRHHRRNSSIISVESINEELSAVLRGVGPPVSLHNARRASYISRHRRGESGESFGRSDWAAHRRNISTESSSSNVSLARLGRPGLGERMFQLDGGVQLTSITGSPAYVEAPSAEPSPAPARNATTLTRQWSYNSLLDGDASKVTYNSLFDMSNRTLTDSLFNSTSTKDDSIFGDRPAVSEQEFTLRGLRPDSMASTATAATANEDRDTFRAYAGCDTSPIPKGPTTCLEADGEDDTMTRSMNASTRQVMTMSRPAKPRRRPANLVFGSTSAQPETPALSSPSTSETSSRISLETKLSDAASIFSASKVRPMGMGHVRQKSSAQVKLQATIKEEPSHATLRARAQRQRVDPTIVDYESTPPETIRSWLEWKREADDEYKRMKAYDHDTEVYDELSFKLPTSILEIQDFIAKSNAAYKPLDQMPLGRHIPHRRKSSLSQSRQLLSPYGLPLPKPPAHPSEYKPKMSLQTKFERTQKSSTGSHLTIDGDVQFGSGTPISATGSTPSRPMSAMFAQFAREAPTPPPALGSLPFSPFAIPLETLRGGHSTSPRPKPDRTETYAGSSERQRVPSGTRRAALGWGRRRNSDGPTKVEQIARQYEAKADAMEGLPKDLREVVCGNMDKENNIGGAAGKRSLPPMAIASQVQPARPVQNVLFRIPVPTRGKSENPSRLVPENKTAGSVKSGRPVLTEQKSNVPLSIGKIPTTRKSKLIIKEGSSTGLQIFEDKPSSTKILRPKISSRKPRPTITKPGRSVRI